MTNGTPITKEWAEKLCKKYETEFETDGYNYYWWAHLPWIQIKEFRGGTTVYLIGAGGKIVLPHFKTTEQVEQLIGLLFHKTDENGEYIEEGQEEKLPLRFELDQSEAANAKFIELKKSGKYTQLFLVFSHHEYSEGIWIEDKIPVLSPLDMIIRELKKPD